MPTATFDFSRNDTNQSDSIIGHQVASWTFSPPRAICYSDGDPSDYHYYTLSPPTWARVIAGTGNGSAGGPTFFTNGVSDEYYSLARIQGNGSFAAEFEDVWYATQQVYLTDSLSSLAGAIIDSASMRLEGTLGHVSDADINDALSLTIDLKQDNAWGGGWPDGGYLGGLTTLGTWDGSTPTDIIISPSLINTTVNEPLGAGENVFFLSSSRMGGTSPRVGDPTPVPNFCPPFPLTGAGKARKANVYSTVSLARLTVDYHYPPEGVPGHWDTMLTPS